MRGGGLRNHNGVVTLRPAGTGTLLVWDIRFDAVLPGLDRVVGALMNPPFQRSLDTLARIARGQAAARP